MEDLPGIKEDGKAGSPLLSTGGPAARPSSSAPSFPAVCPHICSEKQSAHRHRPAQSSQGDP